KTDTELFDKADAENTKVYREGKLASPEEVAKAGFNAMIKGERRKIASNAKKSVIQATLTPDHIVARSLRKQMEPPKKKSKDQRFKSAHKRSRTQKRSK